MNNFKALYFPLAESQLNLLKAMIHTLSLKQFIITKQQLLGFSEKPIDQYIYICLTPDQIKEFDYCLISKQDLIIHFNHHQLQEIAYVNFEKKIDIKNEVMKHLIKHRAFKYTQVHNHYPQREEVKTLSAEPVSTSITEQPPEIQIEQNVPIAIPNPAPPQPNKQKQKNKFTNNYI